METRRAKYRKAFKQGQEAIRLAPPESPRNPYEEEKDEASYWGWEDGAINAGICDLYVNGKLKK